jgi:predicted transcriptional regulator
VAIAMTPTDEIEDMIHHSELNAKILALLKHSPLTLSELTSALRPDACIEEVQNSLIRMEHDYRVKYMVAVGLYKLGAGA